jgi:hypothetical protein
VFHGDAIIPADPETFVALGCNYARDREHAWFGSQRISGADPAKLRAIGENFASDGAQLFHRSWLLDCDAASFELLGAELAADRNRVYQTRLKLQPRPLTLQRVDADRATLQILDANYARDRARVWHDGELVEGVTASTFAVLGHGYGTDGTRVVRDGDIVDGLAPQELVVVDRHYTIVDGVVRGYEPIEGADAPTFRSLGGNFARDAKRVYFDSQPIDADVDSFEVLGESWARDRTRVWHRVYEWHDHADGERLDEVGADPKTLVVIDDAYARDARQVWRGAHAVDAIAATFRACGGDWYTDGTSVWQRERRLPNIDPSTLVVYGTYAIAEVPELALRVLGDSYAADARVMFAGRTLDGPSVAGARSLGGGYLVDDRAAWYFELYTQSRKIVEFDVAGGRLDGADPHALRRDQRFAIDAGNVYCGTQRLDADAAAFHSLDTRHGTDGRGVWFDATRLDADAAKVRVLGGRYTNARSYTARDLRGIDDAWSTDGTTLFVCGHRAWDSRIRYLGDRAAERLRALDLARLRVLDRWWATDGDAVLALGSGHVVEAIEALTFVTLDHGYARDRGTIRYSDGSLLGARADLFRTLADGYATDGVTTWFRGLPFEAHGRLDVLGGGWARDERGIVFQGHRVTQADPSTFVLVGSGTDDERPFEDMVARDRDRFWWGLGNEVPASAVVIANDYALTNTRVYYAGGGFDADAATFVEVGDGYARDAFRIFYRGEVTR